jgi:cellulose synthase/poly-beta-1,6-N-acetylglucosamine synthase-like glycosyltransferase
MKSLLIGLVVISFAGPAFSYAIYPLVLTSLAALSQLRRDIRYVMRKESTRPVEQRSLPAVAVVISAYNEERFIKQRIENLLSLDYPAELLRVYVGSDGSKDGTNEILREYADKRVKPFLFELNRGKASVLNELVNNTVEPIIVFSDANTFFDPDAIKNLIRHFVDPQVGGVSGELRLVTPAGDNQDGLYWRIEQMLKFFEARIGGLLGANGAIYAIRKQLWQPLRADTICDDFCVAMSVAARGYRLAYDPTAYAHEETPAAIEEEFHRRVRIGIGNFQAFVRHPEYLTKTSWGTRFAYVSHKVLRWFTPHFLTIALLGSLVLGLQSAAWLAFFLLQFATYGLGAMLYRWSKQGRRLPAVGRLAAFFFALNWAFLVASWRFVRGDYRGSWRRTSR